MLRPGAVTPEQLANVAGGPVPVRGEGETDIVVPGQVNSHYAPDTPTSLLPRETLGAGRRAVAAEQLYARLHELDAAGLDWIVIEAPPAKAEWAAVRDRLTRAAAPRRLPS